ncbi:hypothetical protein EIP91_009115 [Steccherinum ochraceum]|uniref:Aminotransferase class I/classII domain-containing protein n=1 Tax=Steccherinum ochraceum TaxID=92696 RepID=A0A4R0RBV8_9APHY|nr:hypothetical protein EIP91_009115 [Steccherinum ochraceum]
MQKYMTGLAEWEPPQAGMFYWFKLLLDDNDSEALIRTKAYENGVLALPGTVFLPDGRKTAYVRAAFSLLDGDQADEAVKRLSEVVRAAKEAK